MYLCVLSNRLSVHGVLCKGNVLHSSQHSFFLLSLGSENVGVVSFQIVELIHRELNVKVAMKVLRVPWSKWISIDVDYWLLKLRVLFSSLTLIIHVQNHCKTLSDTCLMAMSAAC